MIFTKSKFLKLKETTQSSKLASLLKNYLITHNLFDLQQYQNYCSWLEVKNLPTELIDQYHYWNNKAGHSKGLLPLVEQDRLLPIQSKLDWEVALDRFRSGYNIGSIFRNADAFGFRKVILGGYTQAPPHKSISVSAMGSEDWVDYTQVDNLAKYLKNKAPKPIVALEIYPQATPVQDWKCSLTGTIVLGNEEEGISEAIKQQCDFFVRIPMYGRKYSLNVSCAFAVVAQYIATNNYDCS